MDQAKIRMESQCIQTKAILNEMAALQATLNPSENDFKRLSMLTIRLFELCPHYRYAWLNGRPVVDIYDELTKLEKEDQPWKRKLTNE